MRATDDDCGCADNSRMVLAGLPTDMQHVIRPVETLSPDRSLCWNNGYEPCRPMETKTAIGASAHAMMNIDHLGSSRPPVFWGSFGNAQRPVGRPVITGRMVSWPVGLQLGTAKHDASRQRSRTEPHSALKQAEDWAVRRVA